MRYQINQGDFMTTTNTDDHPFDPCAAMMMPQVSMAPDPMQQMAATQHALINQQALLMVRSSASFSLLSSASQGFARACAPAPSFRLSR